MNKFYVLLANDQELRPKHVRAIINKNIVQRVGTKYYKLLELSKRACISFKITTLYADSIPGEQKCRH